MKKIMAIMLIAVMMFNVAACAGGNTTESSGSSLPDISISAGNTESSQESSEGENSQESSEDENSQESSEDENSQESSEDENSQESSEDESSQESSGSGNSKPNNKVCETAEEFNRNMTFGWNLGLGLSYYVNKPKADTDNWQNLVYITASDGSYSRSNTVKFNAATKTADIVWKLGSDGVNNFSPNATLKSIGTEMWNWSLWQKTKVSFKIEELYYVTKNGTEVPCDASKLTKYEKDISGGTCGVADVMSFENGVAMSSIKEVRAKIKFVSYKSEGGFMDVTKAELAFGNPVTTQEMINAVRDKGFNLIRVQVCYITHMDEEGNVDPKWLDRVAEVVDYCMNAGVYCLINVAGGGWLEAERETFPEQSAIYRRIWEQVAERFEDYGELLLFESFNEIRNLEGAWSNPSKDEHDVVTYLHHVFVDTVRASGGYNKTRNLVLNTYAAASRYDMNVHFELPEDTVDGHLIGQVHCYTPIEFCFNETNLGHSNFRNEWGTADDYAELSAKLEGVKKRFIDELGIPVIIGEFGAVDRTSETERAEYIGYYSKLADQYGLKLVIFDDGYEFTVFDRETLTWPYEKVIQALLTKGASRYQ